MTEHILFNKTVNQLTTNLTNALVKEQDDIKKKIYVLTQKIELVIAANNKKLFELYVTYIYAKYREEINNQDETFFLSNNYSKEYNVDISPEEFMLKGIYENLKGANKEAVWKYFKTLNKICDKYVARNIQLQSADSSN
jgi:hypothetical protein